MESSFTLAEIGYTVGAIVVVVKGALDALAKYKGAHGKSASHTTGTDSKVDDRLHELEDICKKILYVVERLDK